MSDETYRKMCEHPLIQGMWKPEEGDAYQCHDATFVVDKYLAKLNAFSKNCIWLPRCDDWMEMLKDYAQKVCYIFEFRKAIITFKHNNIRDESFYGTLNEALCQAFMFTKGCKWENEKWERR